MQALKRDLIDQGLALRETHISEVFLGEHTVYKVKKPVQLGFLDFSTLALRRQFCESEVALNRRLAPGVYRGVVPITRDDSGVHRVGGSGAPVEWAVEMRRLPDRDAADQRLAAQRLGPSELLLLAQRLASFHAAARCDAETASYGALSCIEGNVRENFEQTRDTASRVLDRAELAAIERWQLAFLHDHADRFEARVAQRRIRDGHGDLRLEHCYLDDAAGVEIIDCIEFNERFRYGDVCADIAFLAMDLNWHGRSDLSELLLAFYAQASCDYDLYGLVDFYESYRAFVRGKVNSILEADPNADAVVRSHAAQEARKYYLLAEACTRAPLEPAVLYAIGGGIAAGKSSVAEQLGLRLHAPVLEADMMRKHLAGVDALTPLPDAAFAGHYTPAATRAVYAELIHCAEVVLTSGRTAIIAASFRSRAERAAARELAQRCGVRFCFIECVAEAAVCRGRLVDRARTPSVSDGRIELFDAFAASFEPVTELATDQHLKVDTSGSLAATLDQLDSWLARA